MANKFVLNQEDGTVEGGNVRGVGAVDLQMVRSSADQVASGNYSFIVGYNNKSTSNGVVLGNTNTNLASSSSILGGQLNTILGGENLSVIVGGERNSMQDVAAFIGGGTDHVQNGRYGFIGGGQSNTVSSNYSTISGGASNTASTNTHATVVGGYQNSSTGQYSVSGGYSNIASGQGAVAMGYDNTASAQYSVALGGLNLADVLYSVCIGFQNNDGGGNGGVLIGRQNTSYDNGGVVIGTSNGCGSYGVSIGYSNGVSQFGSTAIGYDNNANQNGAVALGYNCYANTIYSHARGFKPSTRLYGQDSFASGNFAISGDAQQSTLVSRKEDTLSTGATTELFLDGSSELIIPYGTNRVWNVTVETQAVVTNTNGTSGIAAGDVYSEVSKLTFKKIGGVSSLVGIISRQFVFDGGMGTAQMNYSAGASQELAIEFQAPAFGAGDITVRVVSKVSLVEVAY